MDGEDRFVERLRRALPPAARVLVGPGDDAAVVESGGRRVAYTTDLLVEAVDFLPGEEPAALGRRAVSVNLSDLAAMGARPEFFLLSIGFPAERGVAYPWAVAQGAIGRAGEFGMSLVGGDLSDAPVPFVSVAAWGDLDAEPLLRSGAAEGDLVFISGFPGRAAAGLRLARQRSTAAFADELVAAFRDPTPRVALGRRLARSPRASAVIDVSDGLGIDSARLARASGVRLVLESQRIPISPALAAFAAEGGGDPVEIALAGGDDYELLFTLPPEAATQIASPEPEVPVTRIGFVEAGSGAFLRGPEGDRDVSRLGHDHLSGTR